MKHSILEVTFSALAFVTGAAHAGTAPVPMPIEDGGMLAIAIAGLVVAVRIIRSKRKD